MTPKVSIIMPVYNAETTVSRMVDSIIKQTMEEWELLAIDDGSTDSSGDILDNYAKKDARIKVFHKPNEGVAMARQLGVDNANGEYSIHADADDWIDNNMLEVLYISAKQTDSDIVISNYYQSNKSGDRIVKQHLTSLSPHYVLSQIFEGKIFGSLWNKLLRTSLYKKYDARFFCGTNYCEDVLIWAQIMKHDNLNILSIDKSFYHYFINEESISQNITRKTYISLNGYLLHLGLILPENKWQFYVNKAHLVAFIVCFGNENVMTKREQKAAFDKVEKFIYRYSCLKWKIGAFLFKVGCYSISRKFLRF